MTAGLGGMGIPVFDYGNNIRQMAQDVGVKEAFSRKGLMMYGRSSSLKCSSVAQRPTRLQMTAGSWIYIGSQGIIGGTFETFLEVGRQLSRLHRSIYSPAILPRPRAVPLDSSFG